MFQIYSDIITSNNSTGSQLRKLINLDTIWDELSDEERQEMKKVFSEIVSKISHEVLSNRDKTFKAFKKGMKKK